jgi:hypothetical protein
LFGSFVWSMSTTELFSHATVSKRSKLRAKHVKSFFRRY